MSAGAPAAKPEERPDRGEAMRALLAVLPPKVREELLRLRAARRDFAAGFGELRLRADRRATVVLSGRSLLLSAAVGGEEMRRTLLRVCRGVLYPYREALAAGYLPLAGGGRVGVCGRLCAGRGASAESVGSLIFRLPCAQSELAGRLYAEYRRGIGRGMLIYAPPAGGKTTALRSLALRIGGDLPQRRAVLIDERGEFPISDFLQTTIDILRGYPKAEAISLAVRTLSPDLILADEIGSAEAAALLGALGNGVPLIATAHAATLGELYASEAIGPLLAAGAFSVLVGLGSVCGRRTAAVRRISPFAREAADA